MAKEKKMHLNIYLIKEEFTDPQEIVIADKGKEIIKKGADKVFFFYGDSTVHPPSWFTPIRPYIPEAEDSLKSSTTSGVLLVNVSGRFFAACYGFGRFFLDEKAIVEGFGLRVALNVIDGERIKSIQAKNFDMVIRNISINNSKAGSIYDFGADIERDILNAVVGSPRAKDFEYASTIFGKDSVVFNALLGPDKLFEVCKTLLNIYHRDDYKKDFAWVDQVRLVKDKGRIKQLDDDLIQAIKLKDWNKAWLSIPEVIEWEHVAGFKYSLQGDVHEDINLQEALKNKIDEIEGLELKDLRARRIFCIDAQTDEPRYIWSLYKCLYFETSLDGSIFLLAAGKWYQIDDSYYKNISSGMDNILDYQGKCIFPAYKEIREEDYNKNVKEANDDEALLLDQKMVRYGGRYSQIEICDIFYKKTEFIHIKRFRGSSTLSHLFLQGFNPAQLLVQDEGFLKAANAIIAKIDPSWSMPLLLTPMKSDCSVVYAIATSEKKRSLKDILPFFSKVSLKYVSAGLRAYGYKVFLAKIDLDEAAIQKKEEQLNKKKKRKLRTGK
ncbi:MAG: TIGR04141 family sporadically distributed protein [Candidatus Omnitrophota bacterium]|nr:TIGR04141 family sporadically distributed protein [Candidatus Omnitrophota bacterium]